MEQLLALVVFGVLGAITVYGFLSSQKASRDLARGQMDKDRPMAGVASDR